VRVTKSVLLKSTMVVRGDAVIRTGSLTPPVHNATQPAALGAFASSESHMMRLRPAVGGLVALSFLLPMTAPAAEPGAKMVVVDLQGVLLATRDGTEAKNKFERVADKKRKALKSKEASLKKEEDALKREKNYLEKNAGKLAPEERNKRIATFQQKAEDWTRKAGELQKSAADADKDLAEQETRLLRPIHDRILVVIKNLSKEQGFSSVLDRKFLVYVDDAVDVTELVAKRYREAYEGGADKRDTTPDEKPDAKRSDKAPGKPADKPAPDKAPGDKATK